LVTLVVQWAQGPLQSWLGILPPWIAAAVAAVIAAVVLLVTFAAQLMLFLVAIIGSYLVVLWVADGSKTGYTASQLFPVLVALAIALLARVTDVNRIPLQDLYRSRLAGTYAVTRRAMNEPDPQRRELLLARAARTRLTSLRRARQGQELVICATAFTNVNREVSPTRSASCLTFDPCHVTLRGRHGLEKDQVTACTADYEYLMGHSRLTLFGVVAMTGGFSPLMGALTGRAARILFTLTNLRGGVWLPHPEVVRAARAYLDKTADQRPKDRRWTQQTGLLVLWYMLPRPLHARHRKRTEAAKCRATWADREAQLWAHVLKLRERSTEQSRSNLSKLRTRLQAAVAWHQMKPVLGLLWAEAVGRSSYRATWIHVTDAGHYDDLAMVEALRRGAKNIIVIDASGDRPDTWSVLGDAMALARADAGVEIDLDPTIMTARPGGDGRAVPKLNNGEVSRPWAYGTFKRRNHRPQNETSPQSGKIWVCKLGWWKSAPWEIRAYAASHPAYPCETRPQQMYSAREFDAYRQLGESAMKDMLKNGRIVTDVS
jgi:hypothetical protein